MSISATESEECRYEIHPEEATVVKRIFHRYIYDRKSIGAIARELTTEGIPSRHNVGHWERSVIWLMLKNPALLRQGGLSKDSSCQKRLRSTKLARDNGFYPKKPKSSTRDRDPKDWIIIAVPR
ncbi:MAG: recombinase family protein [Bdellovibrionales bacterium]|nr:recombinase family protein [Bdellovibrionales bacterium]